MESAYRKNSSRTTPFLRITNLPYLLIVLVLFKFDNIIYKKRETLEEDCKTGLKHSILQDQKLKNTSGSVFHMPKSDLEISYLNHSQSIDGWMCPIHHHIVKYLSNLQLESGVSGLIGEIGVHHGKYFFSLATNLDASEYAVAFDLFEDQDLNIDGSGQGSLKIFMEHASSIGFPADSIKVEKGDSNSLNPKRLKKISSASYRIFSVDGGHTRKTTVNDLFLAQAVLHKRGFVVLDDFVNPDWLGVVDGLFTFINKCNGGLKPFLWLCNKLYLSHEAQHQVFLEHIQKMEAIKCSSSSKMHRSRYEIKDFKVCVAQETG